MVPRVGVEPTRSTDFKSREDGPTYSYLVIQANKHGPGGCRSIVLAGLVSTGTATILAPSSPPRVFAPLRNAREKDRRVYLFALVDLVQYAVDRGWPAPTYWVQVRLV